MGSDAPRHVGSSQTRGLTGVPCGVRQTHNHWNTKEVPIWIIFKNGKGGGFPGGPVVKTSPSNTEDSVRSLVTELRFHMPQGQKAKA